jgi:hypothetical protein
VDNYLGEMNVSVYRYLKTSAPFIGPRKEKNAAMKQRTTAEKQEDWILKRQLDEEQKAEKREHLEQQLLEIQEEERQKQRKSGRLHWKND